MTCAFFPTSNLGCANFKNSARKFQNYPNYAALHAAGGRVVCMHFALVSFQVQVSVFTAKNHWYERGRERAKKGERHGFQRIEEDDRMSNEHALYNTPPHTHTQENIHTVC